MLRLVEEKGRKSKKEKKGNGDAAEQFAFDGEIMPVSAKDNVDLGLNGKTKKTKKKKNIVELSVDVEDGRGKKDKKRKFDINVTKERYEKTMKKEKKMKRGQEATENGDASVAHLRGEANTRFETDYGEKELVTSGRTKRKEKKKGKADLVAQSQENVVDDVENHSTIVGDSEGVHNGSKKKKRANSVITGVKGTDHEMEDGNKVKKKKKKSELVKNLCEEIDHKIENGNKKKTNTESVKIGSVGTNHVMEDGNKKKKKKTDLFKNGLEETDLPMEVSQKKKTKISSGETNHVMEDGNKIKKKTNKSVGGGLETGKKDKMKKAKPHKKSSETPDLPQKNKSKGKRVSFSGNVEVFPPSDGEETTEKDRLHDGGMIQGKRFSLEEDAILEQAIQDYIDHHGLGEDGREKIADARNNPEVKGCWKEIQTALPWRTRDSVYYRAHILLERADKRVWTSEEREMVIKFHEEHGAQWKVLATKLGKHRFHVKDFYRRNKLPKAKKGCWSQDEYQGLFDLVNKDLQVKAHEEKKSKHGMLRDNICWEAISDKLETRISMNCCLKWYNQLSSPMVAEGIWKDTDDYRLLDSLYQLDACCMEDVDWDSLLEHRSGDVCRKRWNQMVKHLGEHANKSFLDQVEVLSQRYCPELLEAREAYANKPAVDE